MLVHKLSIFCEIATIMPAQLCILWITLTEIPSSPHDWYIMTLHTYIQRWKFAYLFSSSEEKIKFTCQKVRCVSSNNNREEQKKFHFRQQQHIGLLITLVEFQLLISSFLVCMTFVIGPNDTLFPTIMTLNTIRTPS